MFQYAAGRALSLASGQPLKLDTTAFQSYRTHRYLLDNLSIQCEQATLGEIPKKPKAKRKFNLPFRMPRKLDWVEETSLAYDPDFLSIRRPSYISGYWQSEKYFKDIRHTICSDFSLKCEVSQSRKKVLEQIRSSKNPVSVHIRRGDYVTNPSANATHGTCEPDWYRKAVQEITDDLEDTRLFVFSDDPDWVRQNLDFSRPVVFVEPGDDGRHHEDMHLMASCKAHIIANSTFSWWGAWLNTHEDKLVVAPKKWFRSKTHSSVDILPDEWSKL